MTTSDGDSAGSGARIYKLVLLFDGNQVSRDDLQKRIDKALVQVPVKKLTVKKDGAKHVGVCIEGSLEAVDRCHAELSRNLLSRSELRHFRLEDEAGDEIRLRAYPILSAIEQQMRAFINRVRAEVYEFDDWKSGVPKKLQSKIVQPTETRRKGLSLDPLEFTEFADLLDLLQARFPTWSPNKPMTPADMLELLSESKTIGELRARLTEKTKVTSLWDSVFARYFEKPEDKEGLTTALRSVIEQRNKVMHHRPVRLGMLAELKKRQEQIASLLKSAKRKLTPEERAEARADGDRVRLLVGDVYRMREMWQQSGQLDPKLLQVLHETSSARQASIAKLADAIQRVNPKLFEIFREVSSMPDTRLATTLAQMQSMGPAFRAAWSPEILEQVTATSEGFRSALLRMTDAMKPYIETVMREREHSVESQRPPTVSRSEPKEAESKKAQEDGDDKRSPN